jgi:hypothetical protein
MLMHGMLSLTSSSADSKLACSYSALASLMIRKIANSNVLWDLFLEMLRQREYFEPGRIPGLVGIQIP